MAVPLRISNSPVNFQSASGSECPRHWDGQCVCHRTLIYRFEQSQMLSPNALTNPFEYRCWLLDLALQSPPTWHFEGVDISASNFPATEYLPKNVTLRTLNIFDEVPADLLERFEIVHVRAFAIVVNGGDPGPLLTSLTRMLSTPNLS